MEKRAAAGPEGAPGARAPLAVVCLGEWAARGRPGEGLEPAPRWFPCPGCGAPLGYRGGGLPQSGTPGPELGVGWGSKNAGLGFLGEAGVCLSPSGRLSCGLQSCGQRPGLLLPEETGSCLESEQAWELAKDGDSAWGLRVWGRQM